jgi:hypothetical protein
VGPELELADIELADSYTRAALSAPNVRAPAGPQRAGAAELRDDSPVLVAVELEPHAASAIAAATTAVPGKPLTSEPEGNVRPR